MAKEKRKAATCIALGHFVHLAVEGIICRFEEGKSVVEHIDYTHVTFMALALFHQEHLCLSKVVLDLL